MTTSAIAGFSGELYVSTDSGSTYGSKVSEVTNVTLTIEGSSIEATSFSSSGWREYIPGLRQWKASADALYISTDAKQDAVHDALVNASTVMLKLIPKNTSTLEQWVGTAVITSWENSFALDGPIAVKVQFQGTGSLTKSAVP